MKLTIDRKATLESFGRVGGICPARSPKPVLQLVKLRATEDATTFSATDLEIGVSTRLLGVTLDEPGSCLLPPDRFRKILASCPDETLAIEADAERITIRGQRAEFELPAENPDLFPDVPGFDAGDYRIVAAGDLKRLVRRTAFAVDEQSTRYALGGCLVEHEGDRLAFVATDGRRLARATAPVAVEGEPGTIGSAVVPARAVRLLDRLLDADDPPVRLAFLGSTASASAAIVRTEREVVYARLVEGRFPRYQDVMPGEPVATIPVEAGSLLGAYEQASIATSEESRGVDAEIRPGLWILAAKASDRGRSKVELPIDHDGAELGFTVDPRYLGEALKTFAPDAPIECRLIDHKSPLLFRGDEGAWEYVLMPLAKER